MKKSNRVFWSVLGGLTACGILLSAVGFALGSEPGMVVDASGIHTITREEQTASHAIDQPETEEFSRVELETGSAQVEFVPSDHYGFSVQWQGQDSYQWRVENGTLTIQRLPREQGNVYLQLYLPFWELLGESHKVTVYYPAEAPLETVSVSGSGDDFALENLNANRLEINNDYGDISLLNVTAQEAEITAQSGNIHLSSGEIGQLSLTDEYGDVSLEQVTAQALSAQLSSGTFAASACSADTVQVEDLYGDVTLEEATVGNLKISCQNGAITAQGDLGGGTIESQYGDVFYRTSRPETDFSYTALCSAGEILLNGAEQETQAVQGSGGTETLTVSSKSGDVSLEFGKAAS